MLFNSKILTSLVILNLLGSFNILQADSEFAREPQQEVEANNNIQNAPVNQASNASFDKRLPPVLPGEQLNDSGKTVKVWSSAGPIPDSIEPKENCYNEEGERATCYRDRRNRIRDIDVIIDQRQREKPVRQR